MAELVTKTGTLEQDNLIARSFPAADTMGITIGKLGTAATLKRGALLAKGSDGKYALYTGPAKGVSDAAKEGGADSDTSTTAEAAASPLPSAILCDDTHVGTANDETAVAYRCGNFNFAAVKAATGYTPTDADIDELRKYDIIFTQMI